MPAAATTTATVFAAATDDSACQIQPACISNRSATDQQYHRPTSSWPWPGLAWHGNEAIAYRKKLLPLILLCYSVFILRCAIYRIAKSKVIAITTHLLPKVQ